MARTKRHAREHTPGDADHIAQAVEHLRISLASLKAAGAWKTANKVRSALKSADGAFRNSLRLVARVGSKPAGTV